MEERAEEKGREDGGKEGRKKKMEDDGRWQTNFKEVGTKEGGKGSKEAGREQERKL